MQCNMKHDKCHNTMKYKYSGQNLAQHWMTDDSQIDNRIEEIIGLWYSEYNVTKLNYIEKFPFRRFPTNN